MSYDDRRTAGRGSRLAGIYREYIGEPADRTTVYGYWLYVVASAFGLLAIVAFVAGTELLPGRPFVVREIAITVGGVAGLSLLLGIVLQMPIRRSGRFLAFVGSLVALLGVGLFVSAYPRNWASSGPADQTAVVLLTYGLGLAILIGVVAFAPLATSKRSLLFASEEPATGAGVDTETDTGTGALSAEESAGDVDAEDGTAEEVTESTVAPASTARVDRSPDPRTEPALRSAAESLFLGGAGEGALFALYEEDPEGWDWRLVHQSVVAENDRTYAGFDDVESAVGTLKSLVEGAGLLEIRHVAFRIYRSGESWRWMLARHDGTALAEGRRYDARDDAEEAVALAKQYGPSAETVEASTAFTLREAADGWTWEFVDSEDETLAETPRRFETEPDAEADVDSLRELTTEARLLDLDGGGFELYEDDGWRWRFVTPDDTPLVESPGSFESREAAEADAELATCAPEEFAVVHGDAAAFEVYERGTDWRWRLIGPTGDATATAPGSFDAQAPAESSARTVQDVAADAPVVELGDATFETYPEDGADGEAGGWRWRLVDDERQVLAESTHPYDTPEAAEAAAEDVRGQVGEAEIIEFDTAAFQLYESETEWRWRLIERDGQVVADSGEDYRTKDAAAAAIPRLKQHVPNAELIEVENTAFELFRDDGWGWRLIDETGADLATAADRHPTRRGARRALEEMTSLGPAADALRLDEPTFQVHAVEAAADGGTEEDADGTADGDASGEGATDEPSASEVRSAVRRVEGEPTDEGTADEGADADTVVDAAPEETAGLDEPEGEEPADDGTRWAWVLVEPSGEVLARSEGTRRSRDATVAAVEDLQSYVRTAPVNVLGELTARVRERGSAWSFDVVDRDHVVRGASARRYDDSGTATDAARQYADESDGATRFTIDRAAYRIDGSGDGFTWELVDPDRRPIVTGAGSHDSREDAVEALTRFRRDAVEAPIRDRGVPIYDLERVEDGWRWRLLDGDRQTVARAGQTHPTREAAEAAMEDAREAVGEASVLEVDGAAFELFEDEEGGWRWRLVDEDGTPLATSFRAHEARQDARRAMGNVKQYAPDAPEVTVERPDSDERSEADA